MLNSNTRYPYPLLRETTVDFEHTFFSGDLEVEREKDGFRIVPIFRVNNNEINQLIECGIFSFAVQIQCRSTYYRGVEYIENNKPFKIKSGLVHDLVELCPCIIAMQDLENYQIEDFVSAFKASKVHIYKNDVVGIGNVIKFRAYYKADEVKKPGSIITVKGVDNISRVRVDLNQPNINVELPMQQYEYYIKVGNATNDQVSLLTGLVSVPVLVMALNEIDINDESDFVDMPWYKSIRAILDKMANGDPAKIETLLEDKFKTVQEMLGDNLFLSLKILDERDW